MMKIARIVVFGLLLIPAVASVAHGQSIPAPVSAPSPVYQGFKAPTLAGILRYSLSASQTVSLGYNGANQTTYGTSLSGNVAFITPSVLYPTSVAYSGGYQVGYGGQDSSYFQSLSVSQSVNRKNYSINLSDSLSYLPQSPSTGLAGLPGLGDIGSGTGATPTVLTTSGDRISNSATVSLSDKLTGKTSLSFSGSDAIQRFIGGSEGLQSDSYGGSAALSHRIDARTSISASYHYGQSSFAGEPGSFESQGATFSYSRQLTRQLSFGAGGGPERIGGSSITGEGPDYTYNANVHMSYAGRDEGGTTYSVSYGRSTNAGSGVSAGAETDSVTGSVSRRLAQSLQGSASVSYSDNKSLQVLSFDNFDSKSVVGSGQLNRALTRTISAYASYSAEHQVAQGVAQGITPLQGLVQTLAFGITYSPSEIHLGSH